MDIDFGYSELRLTTLGVVVMATLVDTLCGYSGTCFRSRVGQYTTYSCYVIVLEPSGIHRSIASALFQRNDAGLVASSGQHGIFLVLFLTQFNEVSTLRSFLLQHCQSLPFFSFG
jgi:hypothetical protein